METREIKNYHFKIGNSRIVFLKLLMGNLAIYEQENGYMFIPLDEFTKYLLKYKEVVINKAETCYEDFPFCNQETINLNNLLKNLETDFQTACNIQSPKTTTWSKTAKNIRGILSLLTQDTSPNMQHAINKIIKSKI